ncbi:DUF4174 domain-containing protein [Pontibacter sp. CAU 1760]
MKKLLIPIAVVGFLLFGLRADAQLKPMEADLKAYKWKRRPLLLFTPARDHPAYVRQQALLRSVNDGLQDRDMVLIELVGPQEVYLDGVRQKKQQSKALRNRFQISADDFAVVLVGKDGTRKLQRSSPVPIEDIFGLIDQMPMRRQEMRGQDK